MPPGGAASTRSRRSSTSDAPVTLLIADAPAALGNAPQSIRRDLAWSLSRADVRATEITGPIRALFGLFGFDTSAELPAAAVTRSVDAGDAGGDAWVRADPAWMDVGSALVLKGWGAGLGLERQAVEALAGALAEVFGGTGLGFSAPVSGRWYLGIGGSERMATTPPDELVGRDAADHLPEGPGADAWRRLMNECQMVLHNHPVNDERRAEGLPPVNSLWFWGSGKLPESAPTGFSRVIGGGALARGLFELPGGADPSAGKLLIADGGQEDHAVWEHWHAAGHGAARVVVPGAGRRFDWRPRHRLRVWRGHRDLEALLAPRRGTA